MPNGKTVKNVIFLGIFAFGVSLLTKDISLFTNGLGVLIVIIASIRFI